MVSVVVPFGRAMSWPFGATHRPFVNGVYSRVGSTRTHLMLVFFIKLMICRSKIGVLAANSIFCSGFWPSRLYSPALRRRLVRLDREMRTAGRDLLRLLVEAQLLVEACWLRAAGWGRGFMASGRFWSAVQWGTPAHARERFVDP